MKWISLTFVTLLFMALVTSAPVTADSGSCHPDPLTAPQPRPLVPALAVLTAAPGPCDPGGDYFETCSGVGLTMWDTCRAAGGSKTECESAARLAQNNCMRDFECAPIIW